MSNNDWTEQKFVLKDYHLEGDNLVSESDDPYIIYYHDKNNNVIGFSFDIELKDELDHYAQVKAIYNNGIWLSTDYYLLKNGNNKICFVEPLKDVNDIDYFRLDLTTTINSKMIINSIDINTNGIVFIYFLRWLYILLYVYFFIFALHNCVGQYRKNKCISYSDLVLCTISLLYIYFSYNTKSIEYEYEKNYIIMSFIAHLIIYISEKKKHYWMLPLSFSILSFCLIQMLIQALQLNYSLKYWVLNIILIGSVNYFFYYLFNNKILEYIVPNLLLFTLGIINHYYYFYRNQPFSFVDLILVRTAANVVGNYQYPFDIYVLFSIVTILSILLFSLFVSKQDNITPIKNRVLSALSLATFLIITTYPSKIDFWDINRQVKKTGYFHSFVKYAYNTINTHKPKGYNKSIVEAELNDYYLKDNNYLDDAKNIIIIMNESFSNLSDIYGFETNDDCTSFINGLTGSNVKKGYAITNVLGGGTAGSEYEMLFGNSLSFLSYGAHPYIQYIDKEKTTIASILKEKDYVTFAYHPYYETSYKRNYVYPLIGFDDFYTVEDDLTHTEEVGFISDLSDVNEIIKFHKDKTNEKMFIFNITMQNHSPYDDRNLENVIYTTSENLNNYSLNQYLSLIKMSDDSFKYLTDYFSSVNEKTIILMFGDHQPAFDTDILKLIDNNKDYNKSKIYINEDLERYIVPYVIWANYDLSNNNYDLVSINYLRSILLKEANIIEEGFDMYVYDCYKKYPVISENGIIDNMGNVYNVEKLDSIEELLKYKQYSYYYLFDK